MGHAFFPSEDVAAPAFRGRRGEVSPVCAGDATSQCGQSDTSETVTAALRPEPSSFRIRVRSMTRTALALALAVLANGLLPAPAAAQAPLRKIGEMELQLAGLGAVLDPVNPVVPKNTPAGVQVIVRAGGRQLTAAEVETLVGGAFFIEAELNGPGLPRTITIPELQGGEPLPADPLILPLPGLNTGGDYELANIRIVSGGRAVMGVLPEVATLKVIDQVLVTKLVTRPLTLDELKEKGIEITSKDYTGFQFSLALRLESRWSTSTSRWCSTARASWSLNRSTRP